MRKFSLVFFFFFFFILLRYFFVLEEQFLQLSRLTSHFTFHESRDKDCQKHLGETADKFLLSILRSKDRSFGKTICRQRGSNFLD